MIPVATSHPTKLQNSTTWAIATEIGEQDPQLYLGKKVSTPQDLMIEELSLQNNKASRMFLERQKRVQRFILEYPTNTTIGSKNLNTTQSARDAAGSTSTNRFRTAFAEASSTEGKENYHPETYISPTSKGRAPEVLKKSNKVLQMKTSLNPSAIAPGYSGPLLGVPPEKFNVTIIPKAYRSPWHNALGNQNEVVNVHVDPSESPAQPNYVLYRSFNRTPVPFGGLIVGERMINLPAFEEPQDHMDTITNLEIMNRRPSFNRAPRGWKTRIIPESCDL
ncbi:myozenin-3 [Rhinatrema bivittatum]|uniref:myozenin-3 n=1 Tax=Rhinatrema bivittatum TaxID=194408 RepID=UPI0011267C3D|nr:myozenin-3 [Rhinatrema bivittatum]XP_029439088.1 myozenin-3 [Rhinatrema bivittatum]